MAKDDNRPYRGLFGTPAPRSSTGNFLNDLAKSLEANSPTPKSGGLGGLFAEYSSTRRSNVPPGGIFGLPPAAVANAVTKVPEVRRKIFFSFHFEEDIRRSVIVRNSYRFRKGSKLPTASFYDKSLWESSKREGEESLKRLIREGMAGSSVTCVLAGTHTWQRRWVRYEIARSLVCGNGLFTVGIHGVNDPHLGAAAPGYNPLEFMGLQLRPDGKGNICERVGNDWYLFDMYKAPVRWPKWLARPSEGRVLALSHNAKAYDYMRHDGYNGLAKWAQLAAHEAGRA